MSMRTEFEDFRRPKANKDKLDIAISPVGDPLKGLFRINECIHWSLYIQKLSSVVLRIYSFFHNPEHTYEYVHMLRACNCAGNLRSPQEIVAGMGTFKVKSVLKKETQSQSSSTLKRSNIAFIEQLSEVWVYASTYARLTVHVFEHGIQKVQEI